MRIGYWSCLLSDVEPKLFCFNSKCLAVPPSILKLHPYIDCRYFTICSDHSMIGSRVSKKRPQDYLSGIFAFLCSTYCAYITQKEGGRCSSWTKPRQRTRNFIPTRIDHRRWRRNRSGSSHMKSNNSRTLPGKLGPALLTMIRESQLMCYRTAQSNGALPTRRIGWGNSLRLSTHRWGCRTRQGRTRSCWWNKHFIWTSVASRHQRSQACTHFRSNCSSKYWWLLPNILR